MTIGTLAPNYLATKASGPSNWLPARCEVAVYPGMMVQHNVLVKEAFVVGR